MKKNKDWKEKLKEVVPYILVTDRVIGAKEFDTLVTFIEQEIEKSFQKGYEEARKDMEIGQMLVKDKEFNDLIGRLGEQISKLNNKNNGTQKI